MIKKVFVFLKENVSEKFLVPIYEKKISMVFGKIGFTSSKIERIKLFFFKKSKLFDHSALSSVELGGGALIDNEEVLSLLLLFSWSAPHKRKGSTF